ncbi:UNVERIFIED_CONTAM: protein OCTOPUS [Sesamum angustifolium]|uniref:Protein OCTOPUS n=1 Tax=Sesamum angustifolium TaxID=2727405 RepID=A0AAW2MP47_9LAMI
MNPTSADPTAAPPQPPQPPRSSFSCDRHPHEHFTGFCPSCLCERLTTLDHSSSNTPSSSRRPSSASAAAAAAIKSLFSSTSKPNNFPPPPPLPKPSKPASFFPELRRTKSFSASKNEALGLCFEPQRKSCDVRVRNTLWSLFSLDDENKTGATNNKPSSSAASSSHQNHQNSKIESCVANKPVFEETEVEEDFRDPENVEDDIVVYDDDDDDEHGDGGEIRPVRDSHLENLRNAVEVGVNSDEIVEEQVVSVSSLKPMKDHIDLDAQEKKSSGGGFWAAASVFSKKWQKWRRKQKMKKQNNGDKFAALPVEKPLSRQYRETQSEIADYGFGRRSCDTDPRFSLDAGRISFDDPRYSFDEPRASWDGYLIGRSFPRMAPMVSVMEDAPAAHVTRSDMQIPVEEPTSNCANEGEGVPGGTTQTREYYSDSSSRRRKSLDRSSSIRKTAAAVVAEIDELKTVSNAKVSPTTADYFHGAKVMVGERDLRDSSSHSLRDDCSETFELGSGFRDSSSSVIGNGDRKEPKKSRRWGWRIWGFIQRRNGGNKDEEEEEKYSRVNGVERSLSESWQDFRREGNGDVRGGLNRSMLRSNSSVSWRNANHIGGSFGSMRKSGVEMNGHGKKKRDDFMLEKNRSARYSPNHVDNGLLRFYLTPMRSSRRGGLGKIKPNNSHSIARSILRLY